MSAPEAVVWQGQPALRLRDGSGAQVTVALHGAHVLSWCGPDGQECFYVSSTSRYGAGHAVRGGVPVIFPQFALRGPDTTLPRHGFARTRAWQAVDVADAIGLRLTDDNATRALWPHRFELTLTVRLQGPRLAIELACRNTGDTAFDFSAALHSYFAVERIGETTLEGLRGTRYLDTTDGHEAVEAASALAFDGNEIDRIHWAAGTVPLVLAQPSRRLRLEASDLPDVVVWNPGTAKAALLNDLTAGDESRFVCVEAAAIDPPVSVPAGGLWRGTQTLLIET